jgi:3-hydroxyisobutyrate dehydrogenase
MNVALIGTGLMGRPMAERVLAAGYELLVFNRNRDKTKPLQSAGARIVGAAAEAIESTQCVILMLADAPAIREVLLDSRPTPELNGRTVIQMGTISPSESIDLCREVKERGGDYLEAPVLGSIPEARAGNLLVMVGGSRVQFDRWSGLLQCFGPNPVLIGDVGKASALKLAMNQLIASLTAGFALSLAFVQKHEIEVDLFMNILRESALYAPTFDKKLERMLIRNYTKPNFSGKHLAKDIGLFQSEAEALGLKLSTLEGLRRILALTFEKGFAEDDYSAVYETVNPSEYQS